MEVSFSLGNVAMQSNINLEIRTKVENLCFNWMWLHLFSCFGVSSFYILLLHGVHFFYHLFSAWTVHLFSECLEILLLVQILELPSHPFYVGAQFHPEFKSRPARPSALFLGTCDSLICILYAMNHLKE